MGTRKKFRQRRWGSLTAVLDYSPPDAFSPAKSKIQIFTYFLSGDQTYKNVYVIHIWNVTLTRFYGKVEYVCTSLPKQLNELT